MRPPKKGDIIYVIVSWKWDGHPDHGPEAFRVTHVAWDFHCVPLHNPHFVIVRKRCDEGLSWLRTEREARAFATALALKRSGGTIS